MFQQPPPSGDIFKIADYNGALVLIYVHELREDIVTSFGPTDAIRADVHVLDGEHAGDSFENALLFGRALVPSLSGAVKGEPVLGRIGTGVPKPGQNPPFIIQPYDERDAKIATDWIASQKPGFQPADKAAKPEPAANGTGQVDISTLPPEVQELIRQSAK